MKPKEATYDQIVKLLTGHYKPATSITCARFEFGSRNRHAGESVNDYLATLRRLASECDFGDSLDTELCHRLTLGLNDSRIQKNLLAQGDKDCQLNVYAKIRLRARWILCRILTFLYTISLWSACIWVVYLICELSVQREWNLMFYQESRSYFVWPLLNLYSKPTLSQLSRSVKCTQ